MPQLQPADIRVVKNLAESLQTFFGGAVTAKIEGELLRVDQHRVRSEQPGRSHYAVAGSATPLPSSRSVQS